MEEEEYENKVRGIRRFSGCRRLCSGGAGKTTLRFLLAVGYIFLMEEDAWLKKSALKALATMLFFSFLLSLLGLVPDAFKWIGTALSVVNVNDGTRAITAFWSLITQAIDIFKTCIFLALAFKALNQSTITVPVVDELLNKHFEE